MILRDISPSPHLSAFVQCFRIVEFDFSSFRSTPVKFYPPKPETVLHFWLEGECGIEYVDQPAVSYRNAVLVCQQTKAFRRSTPPKIRNFQVVFTATALHQLFGWHPAELVNQHIGGDAIFGSQLAFVEEKLLEARSHRDMIAVAEEFVTQLISKRKKDPAHIDSIIIEMRSGTQDVDYLARKFGRSLKQFRRTFCAATGVNPKTYQRVVRFNRAYNLRNRFSQLDWLTVALHCGYYDYMHLSKDFQEFTGMTPAQFDAIEKTSPEAASGLSAQLYKSRWGGNVPFLLPQR
ncbi:MAG TPA: AraC family transcriptional regulator [Cyclobacteriaceae bacterium]|nr:AraC family transcriptional regulator [Cyclobacteriaceae bacterium]